MRRRLTVLAAVLVALAGAAAPAHAQRLTQQTPAAQTLSRCLQASNPRLVALLLIDESQSLRVTDRGNERVAGQRAALTGLTRLATTPVNGRTPSIDVLLVPFSSTVSPDPGSDVKPQWRHVTDAGLDPLLQEAGTYAQRNNGHGTDYGRALSAARELLQRKATEDTQAGGATPCKALIWFTDGKYTVPDVSQGEIDRRKRDLCRRGGLMDGLAGDGVVKFTVALSSTELAGEEGQFLSALTTGKGGRGCGSQLSEDTGEFISVANSARLLFSFSSLFFTPVPPQPGQGRHTFTTVEGLSGFLIDALTGATGIEIDLQPPHGTPVRLAAGGATRLDAGGTPVTQRWVSQRAVEIQGDLGAGDAAAAGPWSFTFIDPQGRSGVKPEYTMHVFADAQPMIAQRPTLVRGEATPLTVALVRPNGRPLTGGALVDGARLTAKLTDPTTGRSEPVPLAPAGAGRYTATVTVPVSSTASHVFLDVGASFTLPGVTNIVPQQRSFRFLTRLPANEGLPAIQPSELRLRSIDGKGSTIGTISVNGSRAAEGCVWFSVPKLEGPEAAGAIQRKFEPDATSRTRCLRVGKGRRKFVTVTLTPSEQATGSVQGTVQAHLSSTIAKAERATDLPLSFEQLKQAGATTWLLFAGLLLLGTLLPLALLHGLNLWSARFTRGEQRLRVLNQPITIKPHESVEAAGGGALNSNYLDAPLVDPTDGGRELSVGDCECRAIASESWRPRVLSLFRGPFAVASAGGDEVVAGGPQPLRTWRDGTLHEVPLALAGTWIFAASDVQFPDAKPDGPPPPPSQVDGILSLVMSAGRGPHQGEELAGAARVALRDHEWNRPADHGDEPSDGDEPGDRDKRSPLARLLERRRRAPDEDDGWPVIEDGGDANGSSGGGLPKF